MGRRRCQNFWIECIFHGKYDILKYASCPKCAKIAKEFYKDLEIDFKKEGGKIEWNLTQEIR
jgi:hypothetical protein